MELNDIDKSGLIRESYLIDGIDASECRSIFLDWAIKLPDGFDQRQSIEFLLSTYSAANVDHPMTLVLQDGLGSVGKTGRRGGRRARFEN